MSRRTIIITGASDGIGAASARQLAALGERVVVVGRSPEKTAAVASSIDAPFHLADYASLTQVRALAAELLDTYERIDVLANNAGQNFRAGDTDDGFDRSLQVNHLSPFLLTSLLLDRLVESRASVIQTASEASRIFGHLDLDDLNNRRKWTADKAYGDSKIANILFTKELNRRFGTEGLSAVSFHPGGIATNMGHQTSSPTRFVYQTRIGRLLLKDASVGGAHLTHFIQGTPGETWQPGEYYVKRSLPNKTNPQIWDEALAFQLWEVTAGLVEPPR